MRSWIRGTSRRAAVAAALLATVLIASTPHAASTSISASTTSPSAAPVASDPTRDAAVKVFIQKHFRLPSPDWIKLGPMTATPLTGIYTRHVTVTNDKGQSAAVDIFSDKGETKLIIGQFLDLGQDPWGRVDLHPLHLDDRPTLGLSTAPVTIVEFADFECPHCAVAFNEIETLVNTTYKGKVRLIYKYYPLNVHPAAKIAAVATECARLQNPDAFWQFARYFYANQDKTNVSNVKPEAETLAANQGLDKTVFDACMNGQTAAQRVAQDVADGDAVHVNSTPTFFINGIPVVGLPEAKVFASVIDSELSGSAHASR